MFSVIIPLFNKQNYIRRTLDSVLSQTFGEYEVIIVNDGSTDDSLSIVSAYQDSRITIYTKPNGGVSRARNYGVEQAKYDHIAFLDADDYWEKEYLEEMAKLVSDFPDAVMYGSPPKTLKGGAYAYPDYGLPANFTSGYIDYLDILEAKLNISCYHTSAVIVDLMAFKKLGGFKENLKSGEDMLVWIELSCIGKTAYLQKHLCIYNHDVNANERAINKIFPPNAFYVFSFTELAARQQQNVKLKALLDKLTLINLKNYYLLEPFRADTMRQLKLVDKENISLFHAIYYATPPAVLKPLMKLFLKFRAA